MFFHETVSENHLPDHPHFLPQCYWIKNSKGKKDVDKILKFENLNQDWKDFLEYCNLDFIPLPQRNKSKHGDWRSYYTSMEANIVYEIYKEDFYKLKYRKDSYKS